MGRIKDETRPDPAGGPAFPRSLVFLPRLVLALVVSAILASCATPSWRLEQFGSLDLAGFGILESELSFFADREADPAFFDGFITKAGSQAGLPDTLSSPLVRDRLRQILILRPAGRPFILGLASLDAPQDLLVNALKSAGFVPVRPETTTGAGPGPTWYTQDGLLLLALPAPGLIAFQVQTFGGFPGAGPVTGAGPATGAGVVIPAAASATITPDPASPATGNLVPAASSDPGASAAAASPVPVTPGPAASSATVPAVSLTAQAGFQAFLARLAVWQKRPEALPLPGSAPRNKPGSRILKVGLDLSSSGVAGRILGALVLRSLSMDFVRGTTEARVQLTLSLRTPAGSGTFLVKKAVRFMLLGISNKLGLDADFLEGIKMDGHDDTLDITDLRMSRTQGIDFIALLMGSSGS